MARMIKPMWMILIASIFMVAILPHNEAAIGCNTVVSDLKPCLPYLRNKGPPANCCVGVKSLYSSASTTPDKQSVCRCLKSVVGSYSGLDLNKAAGLPSMCGISIPYKISPSTDCSK